MASTSRLSLFASECSCNVRWRKRHSVDLQRGQRFYSLSSARYRRCQQNDVTHLFTTTSTNSMNSSAIELERILGNVESVRGFDDSVMLAPGSDDRQSRDV